MGRERGVAGLGRIACWAALGLGCLALANCSSSRIDPKYGVATSARVVEPGQSVPKGGGVYRVGKPYTIAGRVYVPEEDVNYRAEGMASWYGDDFHGRYTANGEVFDMNSISAAHPTLPMPSYVRVTNLRNQRSIVVRINDRGPYANDRIIDLSVQTAKLLGFYGHGLARVRVEYVGRAPLVGSDDRKLMATLRDGSEPFPEPSVAVASNKPYVPEYFDARPMTERSVPVPSERPFSLGEVSFAKPTAPREAPRREAVERRPIAELVAETHAQPAQAPARLTSPVSAFAPVRYDGSAGVMSGRGLY